MEKPTYWLDDPRERARQAPYTFFLPTTDEIAAVEPDDLIQLIFRPIPADRDYDSERMWVRVEHMDGQRGHGWLETQPTDMPQLRRGDAISFEFYQIIGIYFANPKRLKASSDKKRDYWDRCMVDRCVVDEGVSVYYLYRELPDLGSGLIDPEDEGGGDGDG